jgi:uncharacterized protein YsxB (DUF464 family)
MKIVIMGHARHGKDTVCDMLCKLRKLTFKSSSEILNEEVVFNVLKHKYKYKNTDECFTDRVNHREEWFNLLVQYNTPDLARLGKLIFATYDIYCGIRNRNELLALKETGIIDCIIWVERPGFPPEDVSSCTVTQADADFTIYNKGNLAQLSDTVEYFALTHLKV